jgi:hypothetical protein
LLAHSATRFSFSGIPIHRHKQCSSLSSPLPRVFLPEQGDFRADNVIKENCFVSDLFKTVTGVIGIFKQFFPDRRKDPVST